MLPEPWLRGGVEGVDPVAGHLLRASEHIREDVARALQPLTAAMIWATPHDLTSVGFHAKHLAGSTRRLCSYLAGLALTREQLAEIPLEGVGRESAGELVRLVGDAFDRYDELIRALPPAQFGSMREVGRQKLKTTAVSLAIHIAEHGLRHTGQIVSAAKLAAAAHE